jgi:hypothetical protein
VKFEIRYDCLGDSPVREMGKDRIWRMKLDTKDGRRRIS